jgi:hypothetical protein
VKNPRPIASIVSQGWNDIERERSPTEPMTGTIPARRAQNRKRSGAAALPKIRARKLIPLGINGLVPDLKACAHCFPQFMCIPDAHTEDKAADAGSGLLPRNCAIEKFPYKSRRLRRNRALAHNFVHKICAENEPGSGACSHTQVCPFFNLKNFPIKIMDLAQSRPLGHIFIHRNCGQLHGPA